MSPATLTWLAAWALLTVVAAARLLRASGQPEPSVKNGYRWLAVVTACLGVGGMVQEVTGGLIGGASPLRVADLISLAALPALVIGLGTLTAGFCASAPGRAGHGRLLRLHDRPGAAGTAGIVLDSCLLVCSLFVIGLVSLFGPDYAHAGVGRAAFALGLIRPVADLIAIGMVARFAVRSLRLTVLPVLALVVVTVGDALAVGSRISGDAPGSGSHVALIVALAPLAGAPSAGRVPAGQIPERQDPAERSLPWPLRWSDGSRSSMATWAALVTVAGAALVVTAAALAGSLPVPRSLAVAGAAVLILLVIRLAGLARQTSAVAASAQESGWMFSALADTTSDAVMICDPAGTIEYAGHGVADFGYEPGRLAGTKIGDIVHPEDRPAGIRAAVTALRTVGGTAAFSGRVRGADGSWRHVQSTLSRYGTSGEPARLLITSRDLSDRVALRRELTQLTFHDGLTGLPNRAYIEERVRDLSKPQGGEQDPELAASDIAVVLLDLDAYTAVNDLVGPTGGDLLLAQAGRRLRAAAPPSVTVARWGGDEFAILVAEVATAKDTVDLAERLAGQITVEPFSVAAKEIALTASVGVAVGSAAVADQVLGNAHVALSKAKESGGGRVEVFDATMSTQARRRLELAAGLRHALAARELELEYLPVIDLVTSRVKSVEAHARWSGPGERITPDELLDVAQDTGVIVELGDWTLRSACRQVAAWRTSGLPICLSVNCTARQIAAPGFADSVLAALDETGLPPQALTLEITERVLIDCTGQRAADLARLRGKGVRLAVDFFGTGYASLVHLRQFAADSIKIDPSFVAGLVADPTLALLTRTIIGLGRDLGIEVVATGICDPGQREHLVAMGCSLGQDEAVTGSMTAAEVEAMLGGGQAGNRACTVAS